MKIGASAPPFTMRITQFYMALHRVSLDWTKSFLDYAAECGFNYVNLCLYGRIRTRVFDEYPAGEAYTQEEIAAIVEHASRNGIEAIPNFELFAHAESVLKFPKFAHLGELRDGESGRFSALNASFCPSLEETYEFISAYLGEVAPLFPSRWLNAGLDENFDIGYCGRCRARLAAEGRAGIFEQHVKRIHRIVTGQLGKTMMMWDDFMELYPEAFAELPRDIVMLTWNYDTVTDSLTAHTGGPRRDYFAAHERNGFRYIGVPATSSFRNIATFTEYAKKYRPMGMLLSNWGAMTRHNCFPSMKFASALWRDGLAPEAARDASFAASCGIADPAAARVLETTYLRRASALPAQPCAYASSFLSDGENLRKLVDEAAASAVATALARPGQPPGVVATLTELAHRFRLEKIYYRLRALLSRWSTPGMEFTDSAQLGQVRNELAGLIAEQKSFFQNVYHCPIPATFLSESAVTMLDDLLSGQTPRPTARLVATYPFRQGLGTLSVGLRYSGETGFRELGTLNGQSIYGYYHDMTESREYLFFDIAGAPELLKLEYAECTGGVIGHVRIETADAVYEPEALADCGGVVSHPENLLLEGRWFTLFGDGERLTAHKLAAGEVPARHYATLKMKKCEP